MEMIHDCDRLLIARLDCERGYWQPVANPRWSMFTEAMSTLLMNSCNDYIEYANSGVRYRMIRWKDREKYGIEDGPVLSLAATSSLTDPEQ